MEITLRSLPQSSTYITTVPFAPKVIFVGWVSKIDVSEGTIMICADCMKVKLNIYSDERQI